MTTKPPNPHLTAGQRLIERWQRGEHTAACLRHLAELLWLSELPLALTTTPHTGLLCQIGRDDINKLYLSLWDDCHAANTSRRLEALWVTREELNHLILTYPDPLRITPLLPAAPTQHVAPAPSRPSKSASPRQTIDSPHKGGHPFKILREGYQTPGMGWIEVGEGSIGLGAKLYAYHQPLWEAQNALLQARSRNDDLAIHEAVKLNERMFNECRNLVSSFRQSLAA